MADYNGDCCGKGGDCGGGGVVWIVVVIGVDGEVVVEVAARHHPHPRCPVHPIFPFFKEKRLTLRFVLRDLGFCFPHVWQPFVLRPSCYEPIPMKGLTKRHGKSLLKKMYKRQYCKLFPLWYNPSLSIPRKVFPCRRSNNFGIFI